MSKPPKRTTKDYFPTEPATPYLEQKLAKRRKAHQRQRNKNRDANFTKKHMKVIACRAAGMSFQQAGEAAGFPVESARASAFHVIESAKKKLSKNEHLQELLGLKGATLERVAEVCVDAMSATQAVIVRSGDYIKDEDGKMRKVNTAEIQHVPDHRARLEAAKFTTDIHNALPEKKTVVEHKTFEQKVAIIAEIKQNPGEGIATIMALLQQKGGSHE